MGLEEILKQLGLADEQTSKITKAMKESKIFVTDVENASEKYKKLKGEKGSL